MTLYEMELALSSTVHVQYMPTKSGQVVVVGAGKNNNSHVELWMLSTHYIGVAGQQRVNIEVPCHPFENQGCPQEVQVMQFS